MALEVVAERNSGFDEAIELQMVWNPPSVSSQPEVTIPKGATNAAYPLNANATAERRQWKIAVLGHATIAGGEVYVSSQLATLKVVLPFIAGKIETLAMHPGETAQLVVNLQPLKPFDGKAKIRVQGLPEKASAAPKEISHEDRTVSFDVSVDSKCQPGSFKNLFCAVDVPDTGGVIPHNIASGGILRIVPAKKEAPKMASAGKKQ
jgi:hypothetical protein